MRMNVRIGLDAGVVPALLENPEIARHLTPALKVSAFPWITLDSASDAAARVAESSRRGPAFRYTPLYEFSDVELMRASWLELQPTKLLAESASDSRHNEGCLRAAAWVRTGPSRAHRVARGLALARVKLRPGEIGAPGELIAEWIVPLSVGRLFEAEGLRGYTLGSVAAGARQPSHAEWAQLDTAHVTPPAMASSGWCDLGLLASGADAAAGLPGAGAPPDAHSFRALASLAYSSFGVFPATDFARSAEAFDAWGQPLWIVSARARDLFQRRKLRGWRFRPLVEHGDQLHREQERLWQEWASRVAVNAANRLW